MNHFTIARKIFNMRYIIAGSLFIVTADHAWAGLDCTAPVAPSFFDTKPTKPIKPFCLNEISNTHTCDEMTVSQYNLDIDTYNSRLSVYQDAARIYIYELNEYIKKAKEFARCEADSL
jgi:hypothetical protein